MLPARHLIRIAAKLALAAAALTAAAPASAQYYYYYQPPPGYYYPGQQPQPQRQQRRRQQQVAPAQPAQPDYSLRRFFGWDQPQQQEQVQPRQRPRPRRAPPAPAIAKQEKPKVEPTEFVVVFGDSLAELAGEGLADILSDRPEVDVSRKTRSDASLVRPDLANWPKILQDTVDAGQKITVGVMIAGMNDRQPIREGDATHEPLSERWRQIYQERVDAVVRAFQERGIPLIWVGAAPMKNEKLSQDLIAINEILRSRVERTGGTYVDVWPGFVDDENRYTAVGPDVAGRPARLRLNDGVSFTRAGARKVALFAEAEVKRVLEAKRAGTAVAAVPPAENPVPGEAPAGTVPTAPPGTAAAPAKPAVGPVVPLTKPDVSPGGTLVSGRPKIEGDPAQTLQKTLHQGIPPAPRPGRADDFRWPRS
jgi:hypothetical protein